MINSIIKTQFSKALRLAVLLATPVWAAPAPKEGGLEMASVETTRGLGETVQIFSVPEPSRLVLIIIGVCLVSVSYRSAWVSMRRASEAKK